jgi:hypothetical protein
VSPLLVHAIAPVAPAARTGQGPSGRSGEAWARRAGIGGRALRWVPADRLGAWATLWEGERTELGRDELFAHHRLVETLAPGLPVRFGTWAADEAALAALLRSREAALLGALARVEGRRELAVTALWREPSEAAAAPASEDVVPAEEAGGPGRRFLEERRARWRARDWRGARARALAERLTAALGLPPEAARHRHCPSAAVALSSAFLVPAEGAAALGERLRGLGGGFPEVRLLVHGPWPPYSFVGIEEGET